jgi:iron(III) transport system permease protein
MFEASDYLAWPLVLAGRALGPGVLRNAVTQLADYLKVLFKLPPAVLGSILLLMGVLSARAQRGRGREVLLLAVPKRWPAACSSPARRSTWWARSYIILAAFAVRSLPASVRAGVASLQQIDPSDRGGLRHPGGRRPVHPSARSPCR